MSIDLSWPLYQTAPITQRYGENPGSGYICMPDGSHNGLDFGVPIGTAVYATADGTVLRADMDKTGYGLHIRIQHDGYMSLYGHLHSVAALAGQHVAAGQVIGESGNTGNSTGPHLHFEVRTVASNCRSTVDPLYYLQNRAAVKFRGVVTPAGSGLRVRVAPSIDSNVIRYLGVGAKVEIKDISGDWAQLDEAGERWICLRVNGVNLVQLDFDPKAPEQLSNHDILMRLWSAHPELH